MSVYYHSNGGGGNSDWGSWIPIIVLFCIPTPVTWVIAFFWLVSKLRGTTFKSGKSVKRHPYDMGKEAQSWEQINWEEAWVTGEKTTSYTTYRTTGQRVRDSGKTAQTTGKSTAKEPKSSRKKKKEDGSGLILGGAIVAAVFAMGAMSGLLDALSWGTLQYDLSGIMACLMFMLGGIVMLCTGIGKRRRAEQYMNYLAYIGANREVPLAHMAATFGVSVHKLCKDLRHMLAKGILPTGYLDLAEGRLYLTEQGYRAPQPKEEPKAEEPAEQAQLREDAILREIRQVNDDIPGEEMSAKIDRIEEITRKIFAYQRQHPDREKQLRSFLNYYLPTTLKILRAYAQLDAQGIEGENITAAKARIEGMMDQVVAGFEKQLDKLFRDDAMDITTDVEVLENMLKKDGLSGGENLTMEL